MIRPDTLSRDEKLFLKERYHLDFSREPPHLSRDRVLRFLIPVPHVILALGLLLEMPTTGLGFPAHPFEITTWGLGAFGVLICWTILVVTLAQIRGATSTDEKGKDVWSWLFREQIRWQPKWSNVRWDTSGTAIGVGLMALITGRIGAGLIWTLGLLSLLVVERSFDRMVRAELKRSAVE